MNLNIIFSILFASGLFIILRLFSLKGVNNFYGIVINYFIAATCSFLNNWQQNIIQLPGAIDYLTISFSIGFLFIVVFLLTARVTQVSGVGIASVAAKLSMVIPITLGVYLYHDSMPVLKIIGLVLALVAVSVINLKDSNEHKHKNSSYLLPFILFIGCGLVDSSIKFAQHYYISDENRQLFIMTLFGSAGLIGAIKMVYDVTLKGKKISINDLIGGASLGTCNYLSLFFLIRSFEFPGAQSSQVFAMVNLGVVIFSSLWAIILFKEHLNKFKIAGLLIAVGAIITLYFS